jgi:hypothetical protein
MGTAVGSLTGVRVGDAPVLADAGPELAEAGVCDAAAPVVWVAPVPAMSPLLMLPHPASASATSAARAPVAARAAARDVRNPLFMTSPILESFMVLKT